MLATLKRQGLIAPDIFISQSNELSEQLRAIKRKKDRLLEADGDNTIARTRELLELLDTEPDFLDRFDTELFDELAETIIVDSDKQIRFRLKNGLELNESIERGIRRYTCLWGAFILVSLIAVEMISEEPIIRPLLQQLFATIKSLIN